MFDALREMLFRLLLVPAEPSAPLGSLDSIRVFRAGSNFYQWSLVQWGLKQTAGALGLVAALVLFSPFHAIWFDVKELPQWVRINWIVAEAITVAIFLVQLPLTYAALRLGYELRWYIVTDRSLRIRSGTWFVEELTMTFANIQQVNLTQGPLQRFLGIGDLEVTSAGGGGGGKQGHASRSAHTGCFEGVDNAEAIRELILDRLRQYRDTGLGDPDESHDDPVHALTAAQEALVEAVALRKTVAALEA